MDPNESPKLPDAGPRRDRGNQKILLLTNSEYGQANVVLAVTYELLLRREYEVHVASFAPLEKRITNLNLRVPNNTKPAVFHTVAGPSAMEALTAKDEFIGPYPPGIRGAINTYRVTLPAMATTWKPSEYMAGYESCLDILRSVNPDVIVIDCLFAQGFDASRKSQRDGNLIVLSPNTFQEIARKQQPVLAQMCRYPVIASAFPYPVPWYLIPVNVCLKLFGLFVLITSRKVKDMISFRKSQNLQSLPQPFDIWKATNHYLLPSIPESDFPCYIPKNLTPCGPILLPVPPVSESDPGLLSWLQRAPTVIINLGSHIRMDDQIIREFAAGLKTVLDHQTDLQILWKLKTSGGLAIQANAKAGVPPVSKSEDGYLGNGPKWEVLSAISKEVDHERVKIADWLSADPLAILETGHIVCSVHHGGSNSFHEALSVGVPQVILPCWLDTLDFANRVEYLGIGVFGSRTAAPGVEATELSRALIRVLGGGDEGMNMKREAARLAEICGRVGGRTKACEKVVEILEDSSVSCVKRGPEIL